jgi:hypothetical protein
MLRTIGIIAVLLLLAVPVLAGCGQSNNESVTFSELISQAQNYNGKTVTFEAFYFSGFEISALAESLGPALSNPSRITPQGTLIWTTGLPSDIFEQLYVQTDTPSGYPEQFGKVLVTGTFETGETYGHMNAYNYKLTITTAEVLDWTPSATEN